MKNIKAVQFEKAFEYEQAKRQARKASKELRSNRQSKASRWVAAEE